MGQVNRAGLLVVFTVREGEVGSQVSGLCRHKQRTTASQARCPKSTSARSQAMLTTPKPCLYYSDWLELQWLMWHVLTMETEVVQRLVLSAWAMATGI